MLFFIVIRFIVQLTPMSRKLIISVIPCLFLFHSFLISSPVINTEDHPAALADIEQFASDPSVTSGDVKQLRKKERQLIKLETRWERIHQLISKKSNATLGGIKDPVDRWFWIWIGSWGLGLILTLILGGSVSSATLGIIWLSAFGLGSVALILWLVKKFS
jgi:hypothetical protein